MSSPRAHASPSIAHSFDHKPASDDSVDSMLQVIDERIRDLQETVNRSLELSHSRWTNLDDRVTTIAKNAAEAMDQLRSQILDTNRNSLDINATMSSFGAADFRDECTKSLTCPGAKHCLEQLNTVHFSLLQRLANVESMEERMVVTEGSLANINDRLENLQKSAHLRTVDDTPSPQVSSGSVLGTDVSIGLSDRVARLETDVVEINSAHAKELQSMQDAHTKHVEAFDTHLLTYRGVLSTLLGDMECQSRRADGMAEVLERQVAQYIAEAAAQQASEVEQIKDKHVAHAEALEIQNVRIEGRLASIETRLNVEADRGGNVDICDQGRRWELIQPFSKAS